MPLHKRSTSHFAPNERKHGAECLQSGNVTIEVEDTRARATVEEPEGEVLRVGVDWARVGDRRLHTFCECARFDSGKLCRHIWAVLLALGETGPENQPEGKDRLGLRKDRAASWLDLGIDPTKSRSDEAERQTKKSRTRRRATGTKDDARRRTSTSSWRAKFADLRDQVTNPPQLVAAPATQTGRVAVSYRFFINAPVSSRSGGLVLDVFGQGPAVSGKAGKLKRTSIDPESLERLLMPRTPYNGAPSSQPSLALVTELSTTTPRRKTKSRKGKAKAAEGIRRLVLPSSLWEAVLPHLCSQGALGWWDGRATTNLHPLRWRSGSRWQLALDLEVNSGGGGRISGGLVRKDEIVPLDDPVLILVHGDADAPQGGPALVVFDGTIGLLELDRRRDLPWIDLLRSNGDLMIPKRDVEEAVTELFEMPALPQFSIPDELDLRQESSPPQPRLVLDQSAPSTQVELPLSADLSFDYSGVTVLADDARSSIVDWEERTFLRRDLDSEHAALVRLLEVGVKAAGAGGGDIHGLEVNPRDLPNVIEPLLNEGWAVEVQGRSVRPPSPPSLKVESGLDWFDLSGEVEFEGGSFDLSKVLDAVSRGDRFVKLDDGSAGLLPAAWMETYDSLSKLARSSTDDGLRFLPSQALIVDALLSAMPPADVDAAFARLRERLGSFERIDPKKEPRGFGGTLRSYQRQGLGWLGFLREFGLGGVLADDMGLGKTVQVLALIQAHRTPSKTTKKPFFVVAPRSVIYNWIDEASRFTPKLKVAEYRGPGREAMQGKFGSYDIVVTTYGTLRLDIGYLATVDFDTVILDEAQAIKNAASQTAKASRLLVADHRLALTGTPLENHLGELGSIFEFLNPALLGRLPRLEILQGTRTPSKKELAALAEDLRPFILRRTKSQVLPDLPEKTEQVLLCNLRPPQRELYDQLRATYQASLMEQVENKGVSGSAIQVLEALLRLRQVACHPGLVNTDWEQAGSAKLETLFEQVDEVLDEGHKVLIFSQFTKLLAYVRQHLDGEQVPYAYLDGKTRNRGKLVERFQTDPDCNLFLISLKAGGTGLNLTAAGYVFLLDPWWNPAVEAQAIDRTHRIGQTRPVFAYRMIARDTVEEKLIELQRSKRELADSILEGEGQSLRDLTADDLRMLLT